MSTRHQIYQPIAMQEQRQCSGIDLTFEPMAGDVLVELRPLVSGRPTDAVLARALLTPPGTGGRITRRAEWTPLLLDGGAEYAIVVECADQNTSICIAKVGAHDAGADRWVTALPFSIGALRKRADDTAPWDTRADTCIAFTLLEPRYAGERQSFPLGSADVAGVCDLMIASEAEVPEVGAGCTYTLALDDGRTFDVDAAQVINLPTAYTGAVAVTAHITAGPRMSAVLQSGCTLVTGSVAANGDYISPAFSAAGATQLSVTFKALLPPGSAVTVQHKLDGAADWTTLPYDGSASNAAGVLEITHQGAIAGASNARIRLLLTGSPAARPQVTDLFAVTV